MTGREGGADKRRRTSSDQAIAEDDEARGEESRRTRSGLKASRSPMHRGGIREERRRAQGVAATRSGTGRGEQGQPEGGDAPPSKG